MFEEAIDLFEPVFLPIVGMVIVLVAYLLIGEGIQVAKGIPAKD